MAKSKNFLAKPEASYYLVLIAVTALTSLGLLMVLSASAVRSLHETGNSFSIVGRQAFFLILALMFGFLSMKLRANLWEKIAPLSLLASCAFLLLPQLPGLGKSVNGNTNWISVAGFTIQPSEFAKMGFIIWCAARLLKHDQRIAQGIKSNIWISLTPGFLLVEALIYAGKDLGTAVVVALIFGGILFIAGVPMKDLALAGGAGGLVVGVLVLTHRNRLNRFFALLDPFSVEYYKGAGWQPAHSLMGLASGGLFGIGLGASRQKWGTLAEAHTDFIFSVIGEELGLLGTLSVLMLFAALILSIFKIALGASTSFEKYATAGIGCWISMQLTLNIGSVVGLIPVVGVTLPFMSYGGSSLLSVFIAAGFVIGVARRTPNIRESILHRRNIKQSKP
ncbi:MAG: putative lipid II flippase FtsW [Actinobacteria bacterium]|nr:putative lipid II flippase FtsW [Actinomycetota bacterium]